MPSNISTSEGLWNSARELSARKNRRSRSTPMKERLSNFSSDADDNSTTGGSSIDDSTSVDQQQTINGKSQQEVPAGNSDGNSSPDSPATSPTAQAPKRNSLFGRIRKVPVNGASNSNTLDVFHFEGEGLQFRAKLIGIKDVDGATGDGMCLAAMQELKNNLKETKEHKTKINIGVALSGLKIKDEKNTTVMHQQPIPKISYIWRDPTDQRAFGYCFGTPDTGHRFFAIKAEKSADPLVTTIHRLFQIALLMKQREIEMAKQQQHRQGQDGDMECNGSDDGGNGSKKENTQVPSSSSKSNQQQRKVDEANLLDLETELEVLSHAFSQGIDQSSSANGIGGVVMSAGQNAWADFNNDSSSTSSSSDPFGGRGSTPHSIRTITPDPFDTVGSAAAFQASPPVIPPPHHSHHMAHPQSAPNLTQVAFGASPAQPFTWAPVHSAPMNIVQNDPFTTAMATSQQSASNFGAAPPPSLSSVGSFFSNDSNNANPFGVSTTPGSAFELPEQFVSVFDAPVAQPPPVPPPPSKKISVVSNDGFELFQDLSTIGAPRAEKVSKKSFPLPVAPKLGELRGDVPSVVVPAPSTIDPFAVTLTGTSPPIVALSSSLEANMMLNNGGGPTVPSRAIPINGIAPPQVPPRTSPTQQQSGFPTLAPPPAPRRNGVVAMNGQPGSMENSSIHYPQQHGVNPFAPLHVSNSLPAFTNIQPMSPSVFPQQAASVLTGGVFPMPVLHHHQPHQSQQMAVNDPFADQFFK